MSQSTNAIVAYGIPLSGSLEEPEESEDSEMLEPIYGNESGTVRIVVHCSESNPMHFLAIYESVQVAGRGYPLKLELEDELTENVWDECLELFMSSGELEKLGLEVDDEQGIGWYMVGSIARNTEKS